MANTKQKTYKELEILKKERGEEVAKLRARLKEAEDQLAAVSTTIQLLKNGVQSVQAESNPYLKELRGLTQVQALLKIARDNGTNRFKMKEAKKLLVDAGLIKSKKNNAATILFTTIQRSEKFRRVAPGEYEVIEHAKPPIANGFKITQIA